MLTGPPPKFHGTRDILAAPFRKHRERRGAGRSTKDSIATRRQLDYVAEALTPPTLP